VAATAGLFDNLAPERIVEASGHFRVALPGQLAAICASIEAGEKVTDVDRAALVKLAEEAIAWKQRSR